MSKDQKNKKKENVETVENLKTVCRILMEIKQMIIFWHMEKIWPINLAMEGLEKCVDILNLLILKNDVSVSHIIDK